ncbi:amino acid/polyamine/organocation transporter (APC superfamily) [Streptomyces puniciscabiei]|uniref:Amino acid/polyamine/organocation transporter (APC superfamily) n=1 Tax=Streptomyces puniciscabiei TaxID=164348 RepID=A0A542UI32_9ACTN|nr:amino acid permease [Streptomyces puniciscabiei]TQK98719.1 amino acid/polyamine/organocation transporter (APC superfamily) [Streptomyces puniciscabiei]
MDTVGTRPEARARQASATRRLTRRQPVQRLVGEAAGSPLKRTMGVAQLTLLSVGATLGTGIFVVLGQAVPEAGPAIVVSFVLAGVTALFSALSYAELAGMIPGSGSSYSYAYATLGELVAWVCGWCLILEYGVSVAAVAVGWGQYVNELLQLTFGVTLPDSLSAPPGAGGTLNIPAALIVVLAMVVLLRGARESAVANTVMVGVKIAALVLFCAVAFTAFRAGNFHPLFPLGAAGMSAGAASLFFSYIGFDAASTAGEEARNPQRDLPRAIILSLVLVTALYVLVAVAALGAMPWKQFAGTEATLSEVLVRSVGGGNLWPVLLSIGAVVATTSVVLTVQYGQIRILFAMARDGLVPPLFAKVHPRTGVPRANTVIVSAFIAVLAALVPLGSLADATSIGTLFAFMLVNLAVVLLRRRSPGIPRSFRVPFSPFTPLLGVGFCVYMLGSLGTDTWIAFGAWMAAGLVIYGLYGVRHSKLAQTSPEDLA